MPDDVPTKVEPSERTATDAPTVRRVELDDDDASIATGARYDEIGLLGVGGMGEVHELLDCRLGRVVARKRMTDDQSRKRFVREVRIQAQLEHPAIVPVYGFERRDGLPTFTMKRVQGRTLSDVMRDDRGDERFAPRRLLDALANVALAIDYAHSRGVVHRDLKPANIMLGEWGEVYVLDWGVARILHQDPVDPVVLDAGDGPDEPSSVVGTPGYIAPELLRGDDAGSPRSDVYALGCILFRIATGASLHRGGASDRIASTLAADAVGQRLGALGVDLAPELLAICKRATGPLDQRHRTARAFHDELQRYLDGDRDLVLRRDMADRLTESANRSLELAAEGSRQHRRDALQALAAALALSPEHEAALRGLVRLLTEKPRTIPREVREQLARNDAERIAAMARPAAMTMPTMLLAIGFFVWMGVRSWAAIGAMLATAVPAMLLVLREGSGVRRASAETGGGVRADIATLVAIGVSVGFISLATSPWLIVPPLAFGVATLRILRDHRQPWLVGGVMGASVLAPWLLEIAGLLPASSSFRDGAMLIHPAAIELPPLGTQLFLAGGIIVGMPVSIRTALAFRRTLVKAELDVALQAWQLRQMLPGAAGDFEAESRRDKPLQAGEEPA